MMSIIENTVEPLNNAHVAGVGLFIERLSSLRRLKCIATDIINRRDLKVCPL